MMRKIATAFAEETSVFGLHLFKSRRSTFEAIFWCTLVATLSCYTTKTLVNICTKYVGEEVTTVVQPKRNKEFTFPAPMLVVRGHHIVEDEEVIVAKIDNVFVKYAQTGDVDDGSILTAIEFVSGLLNLETSLFQAMLENLKYDVESIKSSISAAFDNVNISETIRRLFRNSSSATLVDFSDLLFQKYCLALGLKIQFSKPLSTEQIETCRREKINVEVYEDFSEIGIGLNKTDAIFSSKDDVLEIEFRTATQALKQLGLNITSAYFSFSADDPTESDSQFQIALNHRVNYHVRLSAVYENLDLRRRPCNDDREFAVTCEFDCKLFFFLHSLDCIPLYFWDNYRSSPLQQDLALRRCEAKDYLNFTNAAFTLEGLRKQLECKQSCSPPCSTPIFVVISNSQDVLDDGRSLAFISVSTHDYPLFREQLTKDFEGFLGDFGGALGLWLGASLASLIHIPIFILQTLLTCLRKKEVSSEAPVELVTWKALQRTDHDGSHSLTEQRVQALETDIRDNILQRLDAHEKILSQILAKLEHSTSTSS